jgi:hypothetical protein
MHFELNKTMKTNTDSVIILRGFGGVPELTPDAIELKREALAAAKPVKKVENEADLKIAVSAMRQLAAIRKGVEATRKAVKAPVIELGKKIDTVASDFVTDTDREETRIQGLVNHFQRKQLDEQRKEQQRLEAQQREAQRLEEEARKKREEAAAAVEPAAREQATKEAESLGANALDLALSAELSGGAVAVAKPKGLVVKSRLNFKITNPIVFCQAFPEFFRWHPDTETLKLDRMRIIEELNKERGFFHRSQFPEELSADKNKPELVRPAGMEVFEETKSHIR